MNRFLFQLASCFLVAMATAVSAQDGVNDVVHLKTGDSAACRITALTDNIITFTLPGPAGVPGGSAKRTLRTDRVAYVEFGFQPGEETAFGQRGSLDTETAEKWWDFHFAHLHRPRSRTAAWGIALASALLRGESASSHKRALSLFDRIIERAWSEDDVASANQGRLRALIATGDLETAVGEAQLLASRTEDPELLIEVKYLLAEADFAKLKVLEDENPRWEEDDEVRPERNDLYHRIIDQYLWPHLFHATREDAAARGLLEAGNLYRFGDDLERARACYVDVTHLYPATEFAAEAKTRIDELSQPDSSPENETP